MYTIGISNVASETEDLDEYVTLGTLLVPMHLRMFSEEDLKDFMVWHPEESKVDETKIKEWLNVMLEEPDLRNYVLQKLKELKGRAETRPKWFSKCANGSNLSLELYFSNSTFALADDLLASFGNCIQFHGFDIQHKPTYGHWKNLIVCVSFLSTHKNE